MFEFVTEMLTANPNSPVYKRIFLKFNTFLFDAAPAPSANVNAEDGDYDSELEKFNAGLHADEEVGVTPVPLLPESPLIQAPELPPVHSEHHLSISVTSHVSTHAVATSSIVSNVVSSSNTPPSVEPEVEEAFPPSPEVIRPAPKKKGVKPTKKKTAPADPPTRTLRRGRG